MTNPTEKHDDWRTILLAEVLLRVIPRLWQQLGTDEGQRTMGLIQSAFPELMNGYASPHSGEANNEQ